MNKNAIRNELIACGKDPAYFIRKYVKIKHPVRGIIPFDPLFPYQDELLKKYRANRYNVILKARQMGISEITAAYAVWLMLFQKERNILVVATKALVAQNLLRKVKTAFGKLPRWMLLSDITVNNKLSIELSNGSTIKAVASSGDAGRSEALSLLIVDEAAHIENMDDLWMSLLPTVSAGGKVIMLSSPNGVGNTFHRIYDEAEKGLNEFVPTKLMWWLHPEKIYNLRDDPNRPGKKTSDWFVKETSNMTERSIAQEYETDFLASGDTVVPIQTIQWLEKNTVFSPISREYWDRNLFVWSQPKEFDKYFISADVARGDGKDFSAFHIFHTENMEQCAEYKGQIKPDDFADLLCETGHRYNHALLIVENNSVGLACLEKIKQREYPNVFFTRKNENRPGIAIDMKYGVFDLDLVPGFSTTQKTRPLMIDKLDEMLRNRTITFHSSRIIDEMRTFIWHNGRPEASKGNNDDLMLSAAIAAWMKDTFITPNYSNQEMTKRLSSGISAVTMKNTEIHGASKDPRHVPARQMGTFSRPQQSNMRIRLPNGSYLDLSDLYDKK